MSGPVAAQHPPLLWCDGAWCAPGTPALRPDDHGLTVGDGVFETLAVRDGVPFALTRHLRRLETSARALGLQAPLATVRAGVEAVLAAGPPGHARLRITVTGGAGPLGSGSPWGPPTVLVGLAQGAEPPASLTVATAPWTRNEGGATAGLKTTSYAENVRCLAWAVGRGADEAVLANTRGELCEGTGSNIFAVIDSEVRTPDLASGCLPGITRELLLEWVAEAGGGRTGVPAVREGPVLMADFARADEVFLTSATRAVCPVAAVDGRRLPAPGSRTAALAQLYSRRAALSADP